MTCLPLSITGSFVGHMACIKCKQWPAEYDSVQGTGLEDNSQSLPSRSACCDGGKDRGVRGHHEAPTHGHPASEPRPRLKPAFSSLARPRVQRALS